MKPRFSSGERSSAGSRKKRPCLIINEGAGGTANLDAAFLARARRGAEILFSKEKGQIQRHVRAAVERGAPRIIVAGGDGSLHEALNAVAPDFDRVTLAVLPAGTGNDMARALGLPLDASDAALDFALHAEPRPADLVRGAAEQHSGTRYFINMCYGGFGGRVADDVALESKARWGLAALWGAMIKRALDMPEHRLHLEVDGHGFAAPAHGLLIANSLYLGGGVPAAPHARLNDGRFDIALVPPKTAFESLLTTLDLLRGKLDESEQVAWFSARTLHIRAEPELPYTMDGESAPDGPWRFELLPGALPIVAGPQAPAFQPPAQPASHESGGAR